MKIQRQGLTFLICIFGFCWFGSAGAQSDDMSDNFGSMPPIGDVDVENTIEDDSAYIPENDYENLPADSENSSEIDSARELDRDMMGGPERLVDPPIEDFPGTGSDTIDIPQDELPGIEIDYDEILDEQPGDEQPGDEELEDYLPGDEQRDILDESVNNHLFND